MWLILGFLFSASLWALGPYEQIKNVRILKVIEGNIVLLDRGLEDGLSRNDHIKLSNDVEGFTSRAICLKAQAATSYWRIYRVPNSAAFSQDFTYSIMGLADREIPIPQDKLRDLRAEIKEEAPKVDPGPNPFAIKRDLPEKLTERDLIHATTPEKRKLFVEKALNQDQMKRDLTDYRLSVFASPFTRQSINEGESLRYGFRGENIASKYRLLTQFEQQKTKLKDPVTKDSVSTSSTSGQAQFVISHLTHSISSLSLLSFNSQRFSSYATPKAHWQAGPIGFTWHVYESKNWQFLDLSYIPLLDMRTTEIAGLNGASSTLEKKTGLRHGFRLGMRAKINERVSFENLLWARPYQDLSSWKVEGDNLNLVNDLKLIFNISGDLYFDYNLVYQKDKLWKTLSNLPETNVINSLNLRYDFNI
jgi:hypothetical protein